MPKVYIKEKYDYRVVLEHYAKEDTWWFPDEETVIQMSNTVLIS